MNRRSFAQGAVAAAAGGAILAGDAAPAAAVDPTPPPTPAMPSFNARPKTAFPGGSIRETTAADAPTIPNMASSYVEMKAGAVRGIHWHKTAAEFGYVVAGECVLTVFDPFQHSDIRRLRAGDIWYVPRGFAHGVWAFGQDGCTFCTVYDDGITNELNALELADLIAGERPDVIAAVLGMPLDLGASRLPLLVAGAPGDPDKARLPLGEMGPAPNAFAFSLMTMAKFSAPGGWFVQASIGDFPMSLTMIGAITHLDAEGVREPHWHPNADEWDLVLDGRAVITLFDGAGRSGEIEVGPGDIGFLPRNQAHAVKALGGPFLLLSVFNASEFQSIGLSECLAGFPAEMVGRSLGLPAEAVGRLPKTERFIVSST